MVSPTTEASSSSTGSGPSPQAPQPAPPTALARAGARMRRWCWEVGVLSRRSLLDLTRNPVLFLSHLGATAYFAGR